MRYQAYPNYVKTNYDNLLSMPLGWWIERIHNVATIKTSNVDKKSVENQDSIKLCNYVDVYKNHKITRNIEFMTATASSSEKDRFKLKRNDVVITKDSKSPFDIGIASLIAEDIEDLVCGYHLSIIEPNDKEIFGPFLYYALSCETSVYQFSIAANGVTRFGLSYNGTKNLKILVPQLDEQKKIANFLDYKTQQIDQLIEKKKALIEKLNEQRIAVITRAVTKGLDETVPMKDSGVDWLGQVPEHWDVRQLKFVASYNDESLSETTELEKEIRYVEISSVNHVEGITAIESTTFEKAPSRARRIVRHGDTIISTVRTYLKAISAINNPPDDMIVSTGFAVIRPMKLIDSAFLSFFLSSQGFIDAVVANSKGVSYPAINTSELVCIHIAFPEQKAEQKRISDHIDQQMERIDNMLRLNKQTIVKLEEYRTTLITNAVTGKIDVRSNEFPG